MKCRECTYYTKIVGNKSKKTDYGSCGYMNERIDSYITGGSRSEEFLGKNITFNYYADAWVELPGLSIQINKPKIRVMATVGGSFFCAKFLPVSMSKKISGLM